jgi:hypothetical protein
MPRYRKISTCIHGDERVRLLSRPQSANGRDLWFYLLTGPHTTNLPGLFRTGVSALAEENLWSTRGTAKALREIIDQGMAVFDERALVMFLPKAIEHNEPESPNVIRSWRSSYDAIPESDLKRRALSTYRSFLESREPEHTKSGKGFLKAFRETFPEAFGQSLPESLPGRMAGSLTEDPPEAFEEALPKGSPNQEQRTVNTRSRTGGLAPAGFPQAVEKSAGARR